jgi:hypothetical protein
VKALHHDFARKKESMKQINANVRLIFGIIFALAVVVSTAYLQIVLRFNTYVALAVCIVAACLFFWIVNGSE